MVGRIVGTMVVAGLVGGCAAEPALRPRGSKPSPNPAAFEGGPPYAPTIDPADFVAVIDNPYLPLTPGTTRVYEGVSDGEKERNEVTITDETNVVMGVTTTVVRDRVFVTGELAEETFDWFAQDRFGNVWYFGEDSNDYEKGKLVSTKGSWEAGVDGAQPGIVMPANPLVGETYRQEFYEGEAEDMATVLELNGSVQVPFGSYDRVVKTEDFTPLEPDVVEEKQYAPGIGVVREEIVRGGDGFLELIDVRTA